MIKERYSCRVDPERMERLRRVINAQSFPKPTMTQAVERGMDLVMKELEKKRGKPWPQSRLATKAR